MLLEVQPFLVCSFLNASSSSGSVGRAVNASGTTLSWVFPATGLSV